MSEFCKRNCANCPAVNDLEKDCDKITQQARRLEETSFDETIDTVMAPAVFENIQDRDTRIMMIDANDNIELVEPSSPEDIALSARMTAASFLRYLDSEKERFVQRANEITAECDGPLKMRATKAGRRVTVTVCNSPKAPNTTSTELTTIRRERSDS